MLSAFLHFSRKEVVGFLCLIKHGFLTNQGHSLPYHLLVPRGSIVGPCFLILCNISFTCRYTNNSGLLELCADVKSDNLALSTLKRKTHNGA